jgi:hypothetical protein
MFFYHPWGWEQAVRGRPALAETGGRGKGPVEQWETIRETLTDRLFVSVDRTHLETFWNVGADGYQPNGLSVGIPSRFQRAKEDAVRVRYMAHQSRWRLRGHSESWDDDLISGQIIRYYGDDLAFFGGWLARKGRAWEGLRWMNHAMGYQQNRPDYYANAAWMLGSLGYPEAAADFCRRGLALEPGRRALEVNLRMAIEESRKEPLGAKKAKYRALAQRARNSGWGGLVELFDETADRMEMGR